LAGDERAVLSRVAAFQLLALTEYLYHSRLELRVRLQIPVECGGCGVMWRLWCAVECGVLWRVWRVWCDVETVVCCGVWCVVESVV